MDWKALEDYDSREPYPYFVPDHCPPIPKFEQRRRVAGGFMLVQHAIEKYRVHAERQEQHRQWELREIERAQELFRRRELELERMLQERVGPQAPRKRSFEEDTRSREAAEINHLESSDSKRPRLSSPSAQCDPSGSQPLISTFPTDYSAIPQKQYPAPLSSYDPKIYPHAHSRYITPSEPSIPIAPSSPSSGSCLPYRSDTPPAELEEDAPPQSSRKGLKRTLSRTQTCSQL